MITKLVLVSVLVCSLTGYDDSSGQPPYGITANMQKTRWGIVACAKWPFGTVFEIEEYGTFVCQDRGGAIEEENQVDIWFPTYGEAIQFGVRVRWCKIYIPASYLVRPSERARMNRRNSLRGKRRNK